MVILGLYRDTGKENGNYHGILGSHGDTRGLHRSQVLLGATPSRVGSVYKILYPEGGHNLTLPWTIVSPNKILHICLCRLLACRHPGALRALPSSCASIQRRMYNATPATPHRWAGDTHPCLPLGSLHSWGMLDKSILSEPLLSSFIHTRCQHTCSFEPIRPGRTGQPQLLKSSP